LCAPYALEWRSTRSPAETTAEARRAAAEGLDRLLVAGGDGTLHHAIRGLAGSDCALGIVPRGTGNDLAGALGIGGPVRQAIERALGGTPRRIDLGRAGALPFAGAAGIGVVGEVLDYLEARSRRWRGPWLYPWALLRTLRAFEPPRVRLEFEGGGYEGAVMLAVLANSPRFGAGMRIAPDARLDDGWLSLVVVQAIPPLRLLALFPRVYRGRHIGHPAVRTFRVRGASLFCDRPARVYGDGEPLLEAGPDGVRVESWPGALAVVA
jgi:diacylglycerol kinase (ATP)